MYPASAVPASWPRLLRFPRTGLAMAALVILLPGRLEAAQEAETPGYRRWAIVAARPLEEKGLPDLLTVELSRREGLQLVERQKLQAVTAELELAACLGSEAAGKRLQLGKLLGADALLLLSLEQREPEMPEKPGAKAPQEKEQFVKLVVSECRSGARLRLEYLPYAADRLDALSTACARLVDEVRGQYAGGLRQVIGVTHFLSKNLVHDYDHLQAGYAYLVESALVSYPGVAVIETEEAQAIRRELDLAGEGLQDRMVPLFVEGEFEMGAAGPGEEPKVRLLVRVTDGKQVRLEVRREGLSPAEATELLRAPLPQQIVRLAQERPEAGLSRHEQYARLTSRASAFAEFGAFQHSAGLREAALLLDPDDTDQRLALIGDYLRWTRVRMRDYLAPPERLQRLRAEEREQMGIAGGHLEHLLRRRALNPREAEVVAGRVFDTVRYGLGQTDCGPGMRELFWRLYPLFAKLDPQLRQGDISAAIQRCTGWSQGDPRFSPVRQYERWTRNAGMRLVFYIPRPPASSAQILDDLFRFLTEVADPKLPTTFMGLMASDVPNSNFRQAIAQGRLKEEDVRALAERLKQTNQPANVFYGRLLLLSRRVYGKQDPPVGAEALREVDELLALLRKLDNGDPHYRATFLSYESYFLERLRNEISRMVGGIVQQKRHPLPENPIPPIGASHRVMLEAVEGIEPEWLGLINCTPSLDVAWSFDTVYAIRARGIFEPIFRVDPGRPQIRDRVCSAYWDGESVWITCMSSGIRVVSPRGEVLAQIGAEQGLPPYEPLASINRRTPSLAPWPLALQPIAPGKCVAIGSIARNDRLWFALISRQEGQGSGSFSVRVFHTATKSPRASDQPDDDPAEIFQLRWLALWRDPKRPEEQFLLVGRQVGERGGQAETGRRPLAVNLRTLEVSVVPATFCVPLAGYNWNPRYVVNGHVVCAEHRGIAVFSPPERGIDGPWRRTLLLETELSRRPGIRPLLVAYQGMLYNPGSQWRRIDPRTWSVERLASPVMPYQDPMDCYGVSAHYGLVGWRIGDRLFRFNVEAEPPATGDLALLYPYVPPARRAAHHQAVQAIRDLGGSVETRWGFCHNTAQWANFSPYPEGKRSPTGRPPEWRTIVYLSETWKGGGAGLKHLGGLHNLRDLYLFRANVGDQDLESVGRVDTLESLLLVETKATDAGLAYLRGLRDLVYLRLEGTVGGRQFSDRGLKDLRDLSRLEKLTLYGDGFSDEGLAALESLPKLRQLWLLNTRMTQSGLEKVGALRRWAVNFRQEDCWYLLE